MLDYALAYVARALHVFPVWNALEGGACACPAGASCKSIGKHPVGDLVPRGLSQATTDPEQIRAWWSARPDASIGIAMRASGLVAFDLDLYKGDGDRLDALEAKICPLPATMMQRSGSGEGLHAFYRAPDFPIVGSISDITMRANHYIVAAPSLHKSGRRYEWLPGRAPGECAVAELPAAWLEALRKPVSLGSVGMPDEAAEPAWLRQIPQHERVRLMREHLALEPGERKGIDRPGMLFDVSRTCLRGFAIRDPDVGLQVLLVDYDPKCSPPYGGEELRRRVRRVYDTATDPSWGDCLRPHEERLRALGLDPNTLPVAPIASANDTLEERDLFMRADAVAKDPPPPRRFYKTGFDKLDERLGGGLCTQQVCGVVAPPSTGKSAFVTSVCLRVEADGLPVLHVSTEMPRFELTARYAAAELGLPWLDGVSGRIPAAKMTEAVQDKRLFVIGSDELPDANAVAVIERQGARLRDRFGVPPLVVIDYVQLLARGSEDGLRARVGMLSKAIRMMSQHLDCPVFAVFSTGRGFYGRNLAKLREENDPLAYLSAAKESGDIESDCASILFLDVDQAHSGNPKAARIAVSRCRQGHIGFVGARFDGPQGVWTGDERALIEMNSLCTVKGAAKEIASISTLEADAEALVNHLRAHREMIWRDVRGSFRKARGCGNDRVEAAKLHLLETRRITIGLRYDQLHRARKGDFYDVAGDSEASQPAPQALDLKKYEPS